MSLGNKGPTYNEWDTIKATMDATKRSLKCAEVMQVVSISSTTVRCMSLWNTDYVVDATIMQGDEYEIGDIVLVIFCDKDFTFNLEQLRNGGTIRSHTEPDPTPHSASYGVVVGLVLRREQ